MFVPTNWKGDIHTVNAVTKNLLIKFVYGEFERRLITLAVVQTEFSLDCL